MQTNNLRLIVTRDGGDPRIFDLQVSGLPEDVDREITFAMRGFARRLTLNLRRAARQRRRAAQRSQRRYVPLLTGEGLRAAQRAFFGKVAG